jgi:hypothetical protein
MQSLTKFKLERWADRLNAVIGSGRPVTQYGSFREMYGDFRAKGLLDPEEAGRLQTDAWGREFAWQVVRDGTGTRIRIGSAGSNGRWDVQGGDDLWVEVVITNSGGTRIVKPW